MRNFIIGVIIGLFVGTGGTMAVTQQDIVNAHKEAVNITQDAQQILNKYIDEDTMQKITEEIEAAKAQSKGGEK